MNIFSIVVCYNPDLVKLNNLVQSILSQSNNVVLVDNSKNTKLSKIKSAKIISLGQNKGISYAQNKGIEFAKSKNADVFVFFDQDSEIDSNFFENILFKMNLNNLSVFSPLIIDKKTNYIFPSIRLNSIGLTKKVQFTKKSNPDLIDLVISSGTCLNLKTINLIGNMDENLFIDFVDTDWSLRCKEKKVPIVIVPKAILRHNIGEGNFKFLSFTFFLHSNKRLYYQIRNCLYLLKKSYVPKLFVFKELFSLLFHNMIIFFLTKNKREFIKSIYLGFNDGFKFLIK
jgi:rhamnosyltransferase